MIRGAAVDQQYSDEKIHEIKKSRVRSTAPSNLFLKKSIACTPGLSDGIFLYQKSQFGYRRTCKSIMV
jgi:hypothetical protein